MSRYAIVCLEKTAQIELHNNVIFGWCNMRRSRLETALYMAKNSKLTIGGVKIMDIRRLGTAPTYR